METDDGSVTRWVGGLKAGDEAALEQLWGRYFGRLVRLARGRLGPGSGGRCEDEEDAALSALNSLWERAAGGKLPDLKGRDELWRLLVVITARKVIRQEERKGSQKRGGGRLVNEAALVLTGTGPRDQEDGSNAFAQAIADEPTPEFAAMVAEETQRRLDALGDDTLRRICVLRMEGHSSQDIAGELGCTVRTVDRKIELIRRIWSESDPDP